MLALFFSVGVILYLTLRVVQYLRSGYTDFVHVFLFHIKPPIVMKKNLLVFILLFACALSFGTQKPEIPAELREQYPEGTKLVGSYLPLRVVAAKKMGRWGLVDYSGKCVFPFEYDDITTESQLTKNNKEIIYLVIAQKYGKWGVVDLNNNLLMPFSQKNRWKIKYGKRKSLATKAFKKYGTKAYEPTVKHCKDAYNSYVEALAERRKAEVERQKVTPVCSGGKWGFVSQAKPDPVYEYDSCEQLNDRVFLISKNGKYGTVEIDAAKPLLPVEYDLVKMSDYFLIYKNNRVGMMNIETGKAALPCAYDNIFPAEQVSPRVFYLVKDDKWGLGSSRGELCGCKYDFIDRFHSREAVYYYKGYTGKIGTDGKETQSAVKAAFEEAYNMSDARLAEKLQSYQEVIKLDEELKAGYTSVCLNNMGVIYQNAGDRNTALSYYSQASALGNRQAAQNYKSLRGQIRAERWEAVSNALNDLSNSLAATASQYGSGYGNSGYDGSANNNLRSSTSNSDSRGGSHPGMSRSQLQSRYNAAIENIRRIKESWSMHAGTHGEVVQMNNLRSVKKNIQDIKSSALHHGISLQLNSSLEQWMENTIAYH